MVTGGLASYRLLRRPLKRMQAMTAEAARTTLANLDRRLPEGRSGDEFDTLTQTLNTMLTPSKETTDAPALLEEVLHLYEGLAEEKGVTMRSIRAEAGTVRGRWQRILRAFGNLVDNAVKFTPPGGRIEVSGAVDGARYVFSVRDTGPAIPPADLGRVFDRFCRVDPIHTGEGTGLGLSISRAITSRF